jgi:hypothetical protein
VEQTTIIDGSWLRSAHGRKVGEPTPPDGVGELRADLDTLADKLRGLWSSALERGDFDEISRLVDASHAIHRAAVALSAERAVLAWGPGKRLAPS